MKIDATFVRSAAAAQDFPRDGLPEVALVGRSNVGKSSLINALVRRRVARTSAAPGKTRLVNIYRVESPSTGQGTRPLYLVDLPGYGFARGGSAGFDDLARAYFGRVGQVGQAGRVGKKDWPSLPGLPGPPGPVIAALLLVDARHPGLSKDLEAWRWLSEAADRTAIVATKIDKLARGERIRALREIESVFGDSVLPVSAVTGEGLDELWKLIDSLVNSSSSPRPRSRRADNSNPRRKATAPRRPGPRS